MELGSWNPDEDEFPPPLPPTKIPRPVTTEPMGQKFQCCVCRTTEGVLTCTRCRAVRYCDKACQKKQWPKHKDICAKIKAAFEETERTADLLKTFKESTDSEAVDHSFIHENVDGFRENVDVTRYDTARRELIYALESCGDDNQSELAFDLAAGNFMDVMKLRYKEYWFHEGVREDLLSYLINANLDQEAFNFVSYFYLRKKTQEPLPYLSIEHQDIETSFAQSEIGDFQLCDTMAIALVKYKRMRHLEFQELCEAIRFKNFIMGTHPKVGKNSNVLKIRGISVIVDRLSDFILKPLKKRVLKLHEDIEILLKSANTSNRYVIPGLLNPESLPPIDNRPMWLNDQGLLEGHGTKEEGEEDLEVRDAWKAVEKTDRAWRLAMLQDKVFLEGFLSRGSLPKPSEMTRMEIKVNEHSWKGRECNLTNKELYGHSFSEVLHAIDKELYFSLKGNEEGNLATANEELMEENGGEKEKKGEGNLAIANEELMEENGGEKEKGEGNLAIANEELNEENGGEKKGEGNVTLANEELMEGNGGEEKEEGSVVTVNERKEENKNDIKMMYSTMCWYCSKEDCKLYKCGGCRKARYCKDECQEKDWDVHGNYCLKQQQQRKQMQEDGQEAERELGDLWM